MQLKRTLTVIHCAICDRTLLLGESTTRFSDGAQTLEVCALCIEEASASGLRREGAPVPPPMPAREGGPGRFTRLIRRPRGEEPVPAARERPQPTERLPPSGPARDRARDEQRQRAVSDALGASLDAFNTSAYRRTVSGIAKSLGRPRVSVVPLGGLRPDIVLTVAWDLSWYQYRIDVSASSPVRLEGRGDDLDELAPRWREWNAATGDDGVVVLD